MRTSAGLGPDSLGRTAGAAHFAAECDAAPAYSSYICAALEPHFLSRYTRSLVGHGRPANFGRKTVANPVNHGFNQSNVRRESDSDEAQDAGSSASGYETLDTGGNHSAPSGRTPAVNSSSTTGGVGLPIAPATQPASSGNAAATASRPVYPAATRAPSAREIALRASAVQTHAAMREKDPLKALKKIFKQSELVRLEVPTLIFPGVPTAHYWKFSERQWLKQLRLQYLDVTFEGRAEEAPLDLSEHMPFFIQLLKSCNELPEKDRSRLSLGIDVPVRGSIPGHFLELTLDLTRKRLFEQLAADKVIVRLGLSGIRSGWLPTDTLSAYFSSLAHNARIEELDLSNAELDDDDACALAAALMENRLIRTLALSGCRMPDRGRAALANVFSKKPNIQASGFSVSPVAPQSITTVTATTANSATTTTATPPVNDGALPATARRVLESLSRTTGASPSADEQRLADSAVEARAALTADDPLPALERLFNRYDAVRIDVPVRIVSAIHARDGKGDGYEKFTESACLQRLRLRNIELIPEECKPGQTQLCQFDFLASALAGMGRLQDKARADISVVVRFPDVAPTENGNQAIAFTQDCLFAILADDQVTARLDMGRMAPRSQGSTALCLFFNSLPAKTKLLELGLRGAVLSYAETLALAVGLRFNTSIQEIDLRDCMPDPGVRDRLIEAFRERSDLKVNL